jgi:hypothetical protein
MTDTVEMIGVMTVTIITMTMTGIAISPAETSKAGSFYGIGFRDSASAERPGSNSG